MAAGAPELAVVLDPGAAHRTPTSYDARRRSPEVIAAEAAEADRVLRGRADDGLRDRLLGWNRIRYDETGRGSPGLLGRRGLGLHPTGMPSG